MKEYINNTNQDTITLDMGPAENQNDIQTQYPNIKEDEQKERKDHDENQDYVVVQYLGQNIPPSNNTNAQYQYLGQNVPPPNNTNTQYRYFDQNILPPYNRNEEHIIESTPRIEYDPKTRNRFVRLIFFIVLMMLLCTIGFNLFVYFCAPVNRLFQAHGLFFVLLAIMLDMTLGFVIYYIERSKVAPFSYFCLALSVLCSNVTTGFLTVVAKSSVVIYGLIATIVTVIVCIFLAYSTFDFTKFWIYYIVASVVVFVLVCVVLISMVITDTTMRPLTVVLLFIVSVLIVISFIMELQMIIGGKKVEFDESDYVIGAYCVYKSVIDLFIFYTVIGLCFSGAQPPRNALP